MFVVREPCARFVSAFNHALRQGRPRYQDVRTEAETLAFARFGTADELASALSHADADRRAAAFDAMAAITHLNLGLDHWLGGVAALADRRHDIVWIGLTETLDVDFERLKKILGLPPEILLPRDPYNANRGEMTAAVELSEQARINLRLWYRNDVALYAECRHFVPAERTGANMAGKPPEVVLAPPFQHDEGHAWTVALPPEISSLNEAEKLSMMLFEGETRLLPTNAMQVDVRRQGGGAHAFWPELLCFSTSDNSDPNTNGRRYVVR
jgi:hypothetical protein